MRKRGVWREICASAVGCPAGHGICTVLDQCASRVPVRFGGRLVRETQSTAIGRATRRTARIHGGIKARENNVEESGSSGCSPSRGKIPNPTRLSSWAWPRERGESVFYQTVI